MKTTYGLVSSSREIDFVKKEEELKKLLEEKDVWYREQMESLQERVRLTKK